MLFKLDNWGHNIDIKNKEDFIFKWRTTNKSNYKDRKYFFYIEPEKWKYLEFCKGKTVKEISENIDLKSIMPTKLYIAGENFGQWFKFLLKKGTIS